MSSKGVIISGPGPQDLWMWGILSSNHFTVKVNDRTVRLDIHFQSLTPVTGSEFGIVSFKGYDQITGCRVMCHVYHATSRKQDFGTILISKQKARPTELAKKYGPFGWKLRKKPLQISAT